MTSRVSTFAWRRASKCRAATARISSRLTAKGATSWSKAMAVRAGTPNTTCWRDYRPGASAGFPISLLRSQPAPSTVGCPRRRHRCGYRTLSLYPASGAFMSARSFQATTGVQRFFDQHDLGARELEPDSFFFNAAARMIAEHHEHNPMFVFVYLAANHFPWNYRYQPDLMPQWKGHG